MQVVVPGDSAQRTAKMCFNMLTDGLMLHLVTDVWARLFVDPIIL